MQFDLGNHDAVEALAVAVLIMGGLIAIAASALVRLRSGSVSGPDPEGQSASLASGPTVWLMLAAASVGAGIIHLALAPEHVAEIGALGLGFFVVGVAQLVWAALLVYRPSRAAIWFGIVGNAAVIAAWAWTRTVGLPVGPEAWTPETIGWADSVSFVFELAIIGALLAERLGLGIRGARLFAAVPTLISIGSVPVIGIIAVLTTLALTYPEAGQMSMSFVGGAALLRLRLPPPRGVAATFKLADASAGSERDRAS